MLVYLHDRPNDEGIGLTHRLGSEIPAGETLDLGDLLYKPFEVGEGAVEEDEGLRHRLGEGKRELSRVLRARALACSIQDS